MPQLDLVQYYSPFSYIAKGNTRIVKGFASTTGPENTDRSGEFVKSPFEFDLVTFKNSPQLLVDHEQKPFQATLRAKTPPIQKSG